MDEVETTFKAAGECYRRAEHHLAEAETSLRKLLARFLVAEMAAPAPEPAPGPAAAAPAAPEPVRRENPEIWGRVEELLAARRTATAKKAEPVVS